MAMTAEPGQTGDLRVLVVDDTLLYRLLLKESLDRIAGVTVVGQADNGRTGLERVRELAPDILLLDIEMPIMNGLEMLAVMRREHPRVKVLVVSSISRHSSQVTLDALSGGAIDFIGKPIGESAEASRSALFRELQRKLAPLIAARAPASRRAASATVAPAGQQPAVAPPRDRQGAAAKSAEPSAPSTSTAGDSAEALRRIQRGRWQAIGIGISTGGPQALTQLLPRLPRGRPPILIVQHMPALFLTALADKLNGQCALDVIEATDGLVLQPDQVYIAPGGIQMTIKRQALGARIELCDAPSENHCKPSVDFLFRGLAESFGASALGILMTGMGDDGARGLLQMRQAGAFTLIQDEASCTVFGMPKQALSMGAAEHALSLDQLTQALTVAR